MTELAVLVLWIVSLIAIGICGYWAGYTRGIEEMTDSVLAARTEQNRGAERG
jgi:hypothetical protein